jgi:hypothetical protein
MCQAVCSKRSAGCGSRIQWKARTGLREEFGREGQACAYATGARSRHRRFIGVHVWRRGSPRRRHERSDAFGCFAVSSLQLLMTNPPRFGGLPASKLVGQGVVRELSYEAFRCFCRASIGPSSAFSKVN